MCCVVAQLRCNGDFTQQRSLLYWTLNRAHWNDILNQVNTPKKHKCVFIVCNSCEADVQSVQAKGSQAGEGK